MELVDFARTRPHKTHRRYYANVPARSTNKIFSAARLRLGDFAAPPGPF
jgi:hypothetical protein